MTQKIHNVLYKSDVSGSLGFFGTGSGTPLTNQTVATTVTHGIPRGALYLETLNAGTYSDRVTVYKESGGDAHIFYFWFTTGQLTAAVKEWLVGAITAFAILHEYAY